MLCYIEVHARTATPSWRDRVFPFELWRVHVEITTHVGRRAAAVRGSLPVAYVVSATMPGRKHGVVFVDLFCPTCRDAWVFSRLVAPLQERIHACLGIDTWLEPFNYPIPGQQHD